jgi:protein-tyrosine phosphatase
MAAQRILFVCMGNICRSPTAEGIFRHMVSQKGVEDLFEIDSAGTGDWHTGSAPDKRAQHAARARNIDLSTLRARQVRAEDLVYFDTIVAMDNDNRARLVDLAEEAHQHKIRLLLEFLDHTEDLEVPDPYYGGENGFDRVLDLIEESCEQMLSTLLVKT